MPSNELRLTIKIPPSVNHYLAYRIVNKGGRQMAMSYKTLEVREYEKYLIPYIIDQAEVQGWKKSDNIFQHYYVDTIFYFPRIDMDCNNYWKIPADCITDSEAVWIDDVQMCERVIGKWYDSKNPRMEIVIHPVEYIGIFENKEKLEEFKYRCSSCKRGNSNCSIRNKAKEGRITEDVVSSVCLKYKEKAK